MQKKLCSSWNDFKGDNFDRIKYQYKICVIIIIAYHKFIKKYIRS